jgi:hypothetical protein
MQTELKPLHAERELVSFTPIQELRAEPAATAERRTRVAF